MQDISAEEFMAGAPVEETPAQPEAFAGIVRGRYNPQQYREYVGLLRNRNTTPAQLNEWFQRQGIGAPVNSAEILRFAQSNPRANIPNMYISTPSGQGQQVAAQQNQPAPTPAEEEPGMLEEIGRALHRTVGAAAGGVGQILGLASNPLNYVLNETGIPQAITGHELSTNLGQQARSAVRAPAPRNATERIVDAAAEGVASAGPVVGVGRNLATRTANELTRRVATVLADAPAAEAVAGAASGAAGQGASEAGAGPIASTLISAAVGIGAGVGAMGRSGRSNAGLNRRPPRQTDEQVLRSEGIDPNDLPEGITPAAAREAVEQTRRIAAEAAEHQSPRDPTPDDLFPNPAKEAAELRAAEERLAREAEGYRTPEEPAPAQPETARVEEIVPPTRADQLDEDLDILEANGLTRSHFESDEAAQAAADELRRRTNQPRPVQEPANYDGPIQTDETAPLTPGRNEPTINRSQADQQFAETQVPPRQTAKEWERSLQQQANEFAGGPTRQVETPAASAQETPAAPASDQAPKPASETPSHTPVAEDVVARLTDALDGASRLTREQQGLYAQARRERLAQLARSRTGVRGGEAQYRAELARLKGEMPRAPDFEGVRNQFSQDEIDSMFNHIQNNPSLTLFEQVSARTGLAKLLDGRTPQPAEINLLSRAFGPDFVRAAARHRSRGQKVSDFFGNALNLPRSLMSSMDLSAPFRQGVFLVGRKEFWRSFAGMFRQFGSERAYQAVLDNIRNRPTYRLMEDSGLSITDLGHNLTTREEAFMSQWAEKIPVIGRGVRASERAYTGFLNKLRADVFDSLVRMHREAGIDLDLDPKALRDIARFINSATGRGDLGGNLAQASPLLNGTFFSPRLIKSRIDMLNPVTYATYSPIVRREAIKSLMSFGGIGLSILGLAAASGLDVGTDPRSSDFGKIRFGNTRVDVFGGFTQYITLGARLVTGETTSLAGNTRELGGGFGSSNRLEVLGRFARNKLAPVPAFVADYLAGSNPVGQPFDVTTTNPLENSVVQRFLPLFLQDVAKFYEEYGPTGLALGVPAMFGIGVNNFTPAPTRTEFSEAPEAPEAAQPAAPAAPAPEELDQEAFMAGISEEEEVEESNAPVPEQSTFENSIASDVLSGMGLSITDNGVRSAEAQNRYHRRDPKNVPAAGGSDHNYGNAVDIAIPTNGVSPEDIQEALEEAGFYGVNVMTRRHGTGPHWHISWDGVE